MLKKKNEVEFNVFLLIIVIQIIVILSNIYILNYNSCVYSLGLSDMEIHKNLTSRVNKL